MINVMSVTPGTVLLGTVALEPNRWGTVDPSGEPHTDVAEWVDAIAASGFDGLELWERHLPVDPGAAAKLLTGPLPVTVFNSYVSFDDADPAQRIAVAERIARCGSRAVKYNVGADPTLLDTYAERVRAWLDLLPLETAILCECHEGTATADEPAGTARFFDAIGDAERVQAIIHTHEGADELRAKFDAYGDRIAHVHVNYLDQSVLSAPPLAERRDELAATARLLGDLGFAGSWTIEFVHGLLTDHDAPEPLLEQAAADLAVLRDALIELAN
jgi:sugar phosphate isomerase/epimerase